MAPPIGAQIAVPGFLHEGQCAFPDLAQFTKHCVLFPEELRIRGDGCFPPNQAHFRQRERQAKSLQHRSALWLLSENSLRRPNHRKLHGHYVSDKFGGGPSAFLRRCFPEVGRDSVGRAQQALLRTVQFLNYGFQYRHDAFGEKLTVAI